METWIVNTMEVLHALCVWWLFSWAHKLQSVHMHLLHLYGLLCNLITYCKCSWTHISRHSGCKYKIPSILTGKDRHASTLSEYKSRTHFTRRHLSSFKRCYINICLHLLLRYSLFVQVTYNIYMYDTNNSSLTLIKFAKCYVLMYVKLNAYSCISN